MTNSVYRNQVIEVLRHPVGNVLEPYIVPVNVRADIVQTIAEGMFMRWYYASEGGLRPGRVFVGSTIVTIMYNAAPRIPAASFDIVARVKDVNAFVAHCIAAMVQGFGVIPYVSIDERSGGECYVGLAVSPYDAASFIG